MRTITRVELLRDLAGVQLRAIATPCAIGPTEARACYRQHAERDVVDRACAAALGSSVRATASSQHPRPRDGP